MTPAAGACAAANMGLDMIEVSVGWVCACGACARTATFDGLLLCAEHAPFPHLRRTGASNPGGPALGSCGGRRHRPEDAALLVRDTPRSCSDSCLAAMLTLTPPAPPLQPVWRHGEHGVSHGEQQRSHAHPPQLRHFPTAPGVCGGFTGCQVVGRVGFLRRRRSRGV